MDKWIEWFKENFDWVIDLIDEEHEQDAIVSAVATWINGKIDMPWVGEEIEQSIIENVLDPIADQIFEAFLTVKAERMGDAG